MSAAATMDNLPASLREMAEYIGTDGARTILEKFPGMRLFVPKRMPAGHNLAKELGEALAQQLSKHFGGEMLTIPRGAKEARTVRNQEIIARYDAGMPVRDLAREYRLTERQIYTILQNTVSP